MTGATSCNLSLEGWEDKVADEPLGSSGGAGGVGDGRGTLGHEFCLSGVEMEDNLPGLLVATGWTNKKLHLDVDQEALLVTNIHWVVG